MFCTNMHAVDDDETDRDDGDCGDDSGDDHGGGDEDRHLPDLTSTLLSSLRCAARPHKCQI